MFLRGKGSGSLRGVNVFLLKPHLCAMSRGRGVQFLLTTRENRFFHFESSAKLRVKGANCSLVPFQC